jgi:hypothetical protein
VPGGIGINVAIVLTSYCFSRHYLEDSMILNPFDLLVGGGHEHQRCFLIGAKTGLHSPVGVPEPYIRNMGHS